MAGLFFAFSSAVMPGLHQISDTAFIASMKSVNRAIQNPVFFIVFFGALILLPLSTFLKYSASASITFWLLVAASLIYLAGVFGITIFGNIPLNNTLDKSNPIGASDEEIHLQRITFEGRWNRLNITRTFASFAAFLLMLIACINSSTNVSKGLDQSPF